MNVCLTPGCPTLSANSRCSEHERERERARGTAAARGYGRAHRKLRAAYQRQMNSGEHFTCWRCGSPIDRTAWHLGHDDHNRSIYRGPECVPCNSATAGRQGEGPTRSFRRTVGKVTRGPDPWSCLAREGEG